SALLVIVVVLVYGAQAFLNLSPQIYYEGDCPYYISTGLSIQKDGDLDLRNQLRGGLEVHGRQIALGRGGEWYPKHSVVMPVLALPFLAAFGLPGFSVFSVVVLGLLAWTSFGLARRFAPPMSSAAATLLMLGGTFLRRYDYNVTPDLVAALALGLALLGIFRDRDTLAGCAFGVAVWTKIGDVFLLPFALGYAFASRGWGGLRRAVLGGAAPLAALLLFNLTLFGSPFVT